MLLEPCCERLPVSLMVPVPNRRYQPRGEPPVVAGGGRWPAAARGPLAWHGLRGAHVDDAVAPIGGFYRLWFGLRLWAHEQFVARCPGQRAGQEQQAL